MRKIFQEIEKWLAPKHLAETHIYFQLICTLGFYEICGNFVLVVSKESSSNMYIG
jgi:hypothetical protein